MEEITRGCSRCGEGRGNSGRTFRNAIASDCNQHPPGDLDSERHALAHSNAAASHCHAKAQDAYPHADPDEYPNANCPAACGAQYRIYGAGTTNGHPVHVRTHLFPGL